MASPPAISSSSPSPGAAVQPIASASPWRCRPARAFFAAKVAWRQAQRLLAESWSLLQRTALRRRCCSDRAASSHARACWSHARRAHALALRMSNASASWRRRVTACAHHGTRPRRADTQRRALRGVVAFRGEALGGFAFSAAPRSERRSTSCSARRAASVGLARPRA